MKISIMLSICLDIEPSSFLQNLTSEIALPSSSSLPDIISMTVGTEYEKYLDKLMKRQIILRYVFKNSYGQHSKPVSLDEVLTKKWLDVLTDNVTVIMPKGSSSIKFVPPKHLVWENSTFIDELNALDNDLYEADDIIYEPSYHASPPKIAHKPLKTIDKYRIRLHHIALPTNLLAPLRPKFNNPCDCPSECLQGHIESVWDWVVHFVCRICGKTYLCDCFREAMKKHLPIAEEASGGYSEDGWPNRFIRTYKCGEFRKGICHICRKVPSDITYCHEIYKNKFIVKYGPYVERLAIENGIDSGQAEDQLRDSLGVLRGDKWISEIELYKNVKDLLANEKITHQARPEWLRPQTLDIFIPGLNIGIEYQGLQHYQPVDFFGGEKAFAKTRERDIRKAKKCHENNVKLIYFRYDEKINQQLIKSRIKKASLDS